MKTSSKLCKTNAVLIDGFNLIYKFPDLEEKMSRGDLPGAMRGLLGILKDYQAHTKKKLRVVFDGRKQKGLDMTSERVGVIDVFYSLDYTADFVIMQFIKQDPKPALTTVVSSDKQIVSFVNRFGAPFIHSENFAELVKKTLEPEAPPLPPEKEENVSLSEEEVGFWEKMFGK